MTCDFRHIAANAERRRAIPWAAWAAIVAIVLLFLLAPAPQACADDLGMTEPAPATTTVVPEPATLVFFGAAAAAIFRRRRRIRIR